MKRILTAIIILTVSLEVNAYCDLSKFRWGCTMYPEVHQKKQNSNLIYCGSTRLYVSEDQFKIIARYQRAGVIMNLKIDDVFFDGPCEAASYNQVSTYNNYKF